MTLSRVADNMPAKTHVTLEVADAGAALVAEGMPPPPNGRVYQVWLKRAGADPEPTDALFVPTRDGSATAAIVAPLKDVEAVLVSPEPRGGSSASTSEPVAIIDAS